MNEDVKPESSLEEIKTLAQQAHGQSKQVQLSAVSLMLSLDDDFRYHADLLADEIAGLMGLKRPDFNRLLAKARIVDALGFWPRGVVHLVSEFMEGRGVAPRLDGTCTHRRVYDFGFGKHSEAQVLEDLADDEVASASFRIMHSPNVPLTEPLNWLRFAHADLGLSWSWPAVEAAYGEWCDKQKRQRFHDIWSEISFTPCSDDRRDREWSKWAAAVIADPQEANLAIKVMQAWIWQIKRKMIGEEVSNHIMPVFVGSQGGGKSTAVKRFITPLAEGFSTATFADIEDDRKSELFHWFPVLLFDEMEKAGKADVESIKSRITADFVKYRPLFTNAIKTIPMRASLIGTSNKPVNEIIHDGTGMRRFYEVKCRERMDWQAVNEVDYRSLWRSVNEFKANPIETVLEELRVAQAGLVAGNNVELWIAEGLDESYLETGHGDTYARHHLERERWYGVGPLFEAFSRWEKSNNGGQKGTGRRGFSNRLTEIAEKGQMERRETGRNKLVEYRLPADESNVLVFPHDRQNAG